MPNTDLTETTATNNAVPEEPKKSAAASRILRAVEKSRAGETTSRLPIPVMAKPPQTAAPELVPAPPVSQDPAPEPLPKLVMPKIGVDAREALRSLSERGAIERTPIRKVDAEKEPSTPPIEAAIPIQERTVSEILRVTKPAETAPLPGETKPVASAETPTAAPVEPRPVPVAEPQRPTESRQNEPKQTKASKSGRHAKTKFAKPSAEVKSGPEPLVDRSVPERSVPEKTAPEKPVKNDRASKPEQNAASTSPAPGKSGNPAFEAPLLGMGPNPSQSFWANTPVVVKAGIAVLALGIAAIVLFKFSGNPVATKPRDSAQQRAKANLTAVPMSGIGGWTANWGDPAKMQGRAISLFRPSLQHADYRIEFEAQIESKAFGWVFRAKDPQNYHAYKIETVKPGLQPLVALARVSVIAGVESSKHYTLIESPVRPDTVFRVRMDSVGSEFTTRINDQLIEVWQDDRLPFGGVGLLSDPGERAQVRKVQIFEMR